MISVVKDEWYVIAILKDGDKVVNSYVEEITLRNRHCREFKNCTIQFTDDLRFALKIKSRELAGQLQFVAQKSRPMLKVEVICLNHTSIKITFARYVNENDR